MAKEATNPNQAPQREWYCLAVHTNIRKHTYEYGGAEKQTTKSQISSSLFFFFLIQNSWLASLQTKAVIELIHTQNDITFIVVAPFSLLSAN